MTSGFIGKGGHPPKIEYTNFLLFLIASKLYLDLIISHDLFGIKYGWLVYPFFIAFFIINISKSKSLAVLLMFLTASFIINYIKNPDQIDALSYLRLLSSLSILSMLVYLVHGNFYIKKTYLFLYALFIVIVTGFLLLQYNGTYSVVANIQYDYNFLSDGLEPRLSGPFLKPNNIAACFFPIYIWLLFQAKNTGSLLYAAMSVLLLFLLMRYINIRVFTVIYIASLFIFSMSYVKSFLLLIFKFQVIPLFIVMLFVFLYYLQANEPELYNLVNTLIRGRLDIWSFHLGQFLSSGTLSNLIGMGFSKSSIFISNETFNGYPDEFHSDYGRVLKTYGIFGFLLYISVIYNLFKKIINIFSMRNNDLSTVLSSYFAVAVYSISNETLHYPGLLLFLVIPIIMANHYESYVQTYKKIEA